MVPRTFHSGIREMYVECGKSYDLCHHTPLRYITRTSPNNAFTLHSSSLTVNPNIITLDVSGRQFKTQRATLQTSPYFRNLLIRWNDSIDKQEDGSYFIDADPDTFQHILNYMRRPSKFPLFWTKEASFDYALYNKIETEADYFLLHNLRDWIRKKRYLDAVKISSEVTTMFEYDIGFDWNRVIGDNGMEIQSLCGSYTEKSRFEPSGKFTLVMRSTVFDETVCVNNTVGFED